MSTFRLRIAGKPTLVFIRSNKRITALRLQQTLGVRQQNLGSWEEDLSVDGHQDHQHNVASIRHRRIKRHGYCGHTYKECTTMIRSWSHPVGQSSLLMATVIHSHSIMPHLDNTVLPLMLIEHVYQTMVITGRKGTLC